MIRDAFIALTALFPTAGSCGGAVTVMQVSTRTLVHRPG